MELTNIFEEATRYKYRFPFKGMISVEDLWDLKLQDLDSVFKLLNKEKKQSDEESLLQVKSEADQELENSDCKVYRTGKTDRSCRETCRER